MRPVQQVPMMLSLQDQIIQQYLMQVLTGLQATQIMNAGIKYRFVSAERLRLDMIKEGVRDAWIVPYVEGIRTVGDEAKRFANRYTDLLNYLSSKKKP